MACPILAPIDDVTTGLNILELSQTVRVSLEGR
jgi:hypothetical protein